MNVGELGGWTNQLLTLYHGTLDTHVPLILSGVDTRRGRAESDFGRGFYTTTVERQARSRARGLSLRHPGSSPAVIRFDVDRDKLARLDGLWFVRGSGEAEDFWSFVRYCRRGGSAHGRRTKQGWYDVVIGPVSASWRRRRLIADADQVSFHTARATQLLDTSNPRAI